MKSFLYFLVKQESTEFKIGITDDIEERYLRLTSVWGEMDLAASRILEGERREVVELERMLHFLLKRWHLKKPVKLEGHSEWFAMECFTAAIEILDLSAKLRDCGLEGRLSHGLSLICHLNRNKPSREKPPVEVVANLEEIKRQWPSYKTGTLEFKDDPQRLETWSWVVDIGDMPIQKFMDMFLFRNAHSSIRLVSETYAREDKPTIVYACVPKKSLALLANYEEYKECHEFIASEINLLCAEQWQMRPALDGYPRPALAQCASFQWRPNPENRATIPMPWQIIFAKVNGDYTERDRKLYAFLAHAVWDDLETTRIHALSVAEINKVFRELGGDFSPQWIWESATRLNKTSIEWEERADGRLSQGIASLLSYARTDKEAQESGYLNFEIPAGLIQVFKAPGRFALLRIHFMLGLSGKYAVTLYEILESVVNMRNPVLEVDIATLRQWLKVEDGKLGRYADMRRFILEPALKQINDNPEGAGFSVDVQPIKAGRAVDRLRFTLTKTSFRREAEGKLKRDKPEAALSSGTIRLKTSTYEQAKKAAPGLDVYYLETEWREWVGKKKTAMENPDASFIGFCKSKAKNTAR